jgi:fused signal recognition particle receptor
MFGLLRSKLAGFVNSLVRKEEEKPAEAAEPQAKPGKPAEAPVASQAPAPEKQVQKTEARIVNNATAAAPERAPAQREIKPRLSVVTQVKSIFSGEIEIRAQDVEAMLYDLELALLEADVSYDVSKDFADALRNRLTGMRVKKGAVAEGVRNALQESLLQMLDVPKPDVLALAAQKKMSGEPLIIAFLGPNGAGKTTTIAKLAAMLRQHGFSCVVSASDTFRAGSIQQLEEHAKRLGVPLIKHAYGADPAAVAFDAIGYARSRGVNAVLIDTAGRQETNANLIDEMKKIVRVAKPDLKIFVGEAIAGHAIVEQVGRFKDAVGVDGVVLTKMDCDPKGGTALSIAKTTGVPILFIGSGQEYGDLQPFDARAIAKNIAG